MHLRLRRFGTPVGNGEEVTAVTYTTQAPPTAAEQNLAWQRVNQETGFSIKLPLTQLADYPTKLNTVIAGGALPDLLSLGSEIVGFLLPSEAKASLSA